MTTLISGRWVTRSTKRSEMAGIPPRTARSTGSRFAPVGAGAPKGSKVSTSGCPEAAYSTTFARWIVSLQPRARPGGRPSGHDCQGVRTSPAASRRQWSRRALGRRPQKSRGRYPGGHVQWPLSSAVAPSRAPMPRTPPSAGGFRGSGRPNEPAAHGLALPRPSGRTHSTPVGAGRDNPSPRPVGALSGSETPASRRARTSATAPGTPSPGALPPSGS